MAASYAGEAMKDKCTPYTGDMAVDGMPGVGGSGVCAHVHLPAIVRRPYKAPASSLNLVVSPIESVLPIICKADVASCRLIGHSKREFAGIGWR